jgi:glycosyltransferase involved in cell wall biosynthesis
MAWLAVRKLKEGPGPWLRAARLGVFQLLPARAQELLLRARGHRRQARALPPSAGPEVKGLVVVVLPVYQQAQLLGAAIESVLAQTWQALELIVLDDGSGPEVAAVLARYAGEGRVRILRQDNRGLPQALDAAFELAQGEYWCWTSADNLMRPRMLEELVGFLRARPEVAMVYADYELIDGNGAPLRGTDFRVASRAGPDDARVRLPRGTAALAVVADNFIGPCFCYRGTVGRLLSGYSPEMGIEDYDYWLRIDGAFRIEHLGRDTALYRYRVHGDSLSARASELGIRQRLAGLMARQRRRAEWFATPLQFVGAAVDWLRPLLQPGEALVSEIPHGRKTLVIADAAALHREPLPALPASAAAAVWFDSVAEVYAGHRALAGEVAAFTADPAVAARLAVFTRSVFLGDRDAATLSTARAFANDRTFQRCEWPQQRSRPAPAPCCQRPLRVLLLADGFAQGGMEQVIADLAVGLAGRGAAVSVLALQPAPGAMAWLQQRGIDVLDPDAGRDGTAFRSLLQKERFDVVSAHDCTARADAAAAAAVPFVQTIHGAYVWLPPERRARYRTADAHTTAYVTVSAAALEYADVQLELDVGKAVIVHNGIDLERWQGHGPRADVHRRTEWGLAAADFVFLQVGTLSPPKGQHIAIRALAAVRNREPRAKLVCLGRENDPHHTRLLRAEAERLGVAEAVVFAGFHADPAPFYRLADALVLPSFYEGCSVAALEALAQGLPLVLSDVGAAAEQLALGSGRLVRPPFASVTELDWANLQRLLGREHPEYTARLSAAMLQVMQLPRRELSAPQRWAIDRRRMADAYLRLFGWLHQGGAPAAARAWLRRPASAPSPSPAAMTPSLSR